MDPFAIDAESEDLLDGVQTGSFGIRFLARLIDWVLHFVLGFIGGMIGAVVLVVLSVAGVVGHDWLQAIGEVGFAWNLAWGTLAAVLYEVACEGIGGTTVGKLALGYRVVTTDLRPCGPGKALIRSAAYVVDAMFFGLVAYSAMSSSPINQRLGDKWAGTMVAKASGLPASARRPAGLVALGLVAGAVVHTATICFSVVVSAL